MLNIHVWWARLTFPVTWDKDLQAKCVSDTCNTIEKRRSKSDVVASAALRITAKRNVYQSGIEPHVVASAALSKHSSVTIKGNDQ